MRMDSDDYLSIFLSDTPLMDVRAPVEFSKGSFPQASNVPLLDDEQPLAITEGIGKYDIFAICSGGGLSGQAGAIRLGISRALIKLDGELRQTLRKHRFLTRDPREKERKKYGQPGARKKFQFSKR